MAAVLDLVVLEVPKAEAIRLLGASALSMRAGEDAEGRQVVLGMAGELVAVKADPAVVDEELLLEMAGHSAAEMRMRFRQLADDAKASVTTVREVKV